MDKELLEKIDVLIYVNNKMDKRLNILLNMFDSYMSFRYGVRFNIKSGCFDKWKK